MDHVDKLNTINIEISIRLKRFRRMFIKPKANNIVQSYLNIYGNEDRYWIRNYLDQKQLDVRFIEYL